MLEDLSELFYNPWIFWGAPVIIALVLEVVGRWRGRARRPGRSRSGRPGPSATG